MKMQIGIIFVLLYGFAECLPIEKPLTNKPISKNKSSNKRSLDFETSYNPWANLWTPHVPHLNSLDYFGSYWKDHFHSLPEYSLHDLSNLEHLYQDDITFLGPHNTLPIEISKDGHFTPDYSDGLAYPDPYLIVGPKANNVANYLYSKELFFSDIPHLRAIKHNQEERIKNGLEPRRLGSLRGGLPFTRGRAFS